MRIIAGSAKGFRLFSPKSNAIRPALDQVKEAVFNILFDVSDCAVLDLFAGTGSVGLEALSRGAAKCVFVDAGREGVELIHRNLEKTRLADRAEVRHQKVDVAIERLAKQDESFDLIFVDPPYEKGLVNPTLAALVATTLLKKSGKIIIEHHPKEEIEPPADFQILDQRNYGQTRITFLGWKTD